MEQILAFILGAGAGLIIVGVVLAFRTVKQVTEIEKAITGHQEWILRNDEMINRRIDQEIDRVNNIYNDCIKYTDSRVDKLEAKITKEKQVLKG